MKKTFLLSFILIMLIPFGCQDSEDYQVIEDPISPVVVDLNQVPYQNLADYHFFEGDIKNQNPSVGVEPYLPASELFTDYALKKRFVWMPAGVKATYVSDDKILEFPIGTVLIKSFYYEQVQPSNTTKIIETRLMIRKESGWIFAEYVWNDAQTQATLQMEGSYKNIAWINEANVLKSANYRIPSETECLICHKSNNTGVPIGTKPQNLNFDYAYANGTKNQLAYWKEKGYLQDNTPIPTLSVVNYRDESQPLDLRVRSYLDINCAHCHQSNSHCDYRPIRLAFSETISSENMGICVPPDQNIGASLTNIITPNNINRSVMHFRLNSNDDAYKMPLLGRSIQHEEGIQLLSSYINSLTPCD